MAGVSSDFFHGGQILQGLSRAARSRVPGATLAFLLCLGWAAPWWQAAGAQGYRLEGVVKDPAGSPIAQAEVRFRSGALSLSSRTDAQGRFLFPNLHQTAGVLTVQAAGFESAKQAWDSGGRPVSKVVIVLSLARLTQQVTVTATRTETPVSQTAGSVVVLPPQDLADTAALTLDGALRQVPGFTLYRRTGSEIANPTTQGISLRGVGASGASRGLVLEDGIPINDPFGGWVYWDRIPRQAVDRIEVAEGGASDLYGSDAMGGVVNILTRRASTSEVSLDTSYGNEDTPDASLWANTVWGRWSAQLGAEAFNTDGYVLVPQSLRGPVDTAAGSNHTDLTVTAARQVSHRARAFVTGAIFGEARKNGTPIQTNRTHLRELAAGLDWESAAAGAFALRGYGEAQLFDQNFSAIAPSRETETLTDRQRVPAQEGGFSAQWTRSFRSRQTWVAGVEGRDVGGASNELLYSRGRVSSAAGKGGRQNNEGIFAEDIIRLGSRWILTAGGRLDRWSNFDALSTTRPLAPPGPISVIDFPMRSETAFSPHLAALHRLNSITSLYASAYQAFRAPTLNELYRPFRVGNVLTLANSDLNAEHLTGAEAGAAVRPFEGKLRVHASLFWNEIKQPVANVTLSATSALITKQRENLGSTRSRGFEIEAQGQVRPDFTLSGGYQFVDATVLSFPADVALQGLFVPQVPRHTATVQARYSKPSWFTMAAQARYIGVQYDDDLNLYPLDRAFILDFFASRPIGRRMEIYGALENLTGQRYQVARVPYTELGPPLLARIGFRFQWGAR